MTATPRADSMRIAIVHYHFSPGGVTSVIRSASHSLTTASIPHVILCGSSPPEDLPIRIIGDLQYLKSTRRSAASLLAELRMAAEDAIGGTPDVWHFHNHSLGKNILFPEIVHLLAEAGDRIILHLHDLAEDGRPQNFPLIADQAHLYPVSPRITYAFINKRDREQFIHAGLPEGNAVILPNLIPLENPSRSPGGRPLVLYPSRAIRRKNIGELLLLSILAPQGSRFAITRAPEDPAAFAIHEDWRGFADEHRLPVDFNVVGRIPPEADGDASYDSWINAATHFVTTSVAEGFGLLFTEAAARGKPLVGRDLPTNPRPDHRQLYQRILIPSGWIDPELLRFHLTAAITETHRLYQQARPPGVIDRTFELLHYDGHFDFGNLPEPLQKQVILRVLDDPSSQPLIHGHPAGLWMEKALEHTRAAAAFPPLPPHLTLIPLYENLIGQPFAPAAYLPPDGVLRAYLTPENFHFLLTSPPKIRAVIFDIYGTLLIAPPGTIRPDATFDPRLTSILESSGYPAIPSPTTVLHQTVLRHHAQSPHEHPEIDLRAVWQEMLSTTDDLTSLIGVVEDAWHPCQPMPGASETLHRLADDGILLGILSNAQANTLPTLGKALGSASRRFDPDLTVLSYQHLIAKPSPALFQLLAGKLASRGIAPSETLFVGNDPRQDIIPATAAGFRTALFTGHPDSLRPGECTPDLTLRSLSEILPATSSF